LISRQVAELHWIRLAAVPLAFGAIAGLATLALRSAVSDGLLGALYVASSAVLVVWIARATPASAAGPRESSVRKEASE
jgi:hypothetical protein